MMLNAEKSLALSRGLYYNLLMSVCIAWEIGAVSPLKLGRAMEAKTESRVFVLSSCSRNVVRTYNAVKAIVGFKDECVFWSCWVLRQIDVGG